MESRELAKAASFGKATRIENGQDGPCGGQPLRGCGDPHAAIRAVLMASQLQTFVRVRSGSRAPSSSTGRAVVNCLEMDRKRECQCLIQLRTWF